MNKTYSKPFSQTYVMQLTAKHCHIAIDTSINRTLARIADFDTNIEKSKEVFDTLSSLHAFRELLTEFQTNNPNIFIEMDKS